MSALASVLSSARSSWDSNYTIGDPRWRLTQLYRLYQLLMDNRGQLVEDFSRGSKMKGSSHHVRLLSQCTNCQPKRLKGNLHWQSARFTIISASCHTKSARSPSVEPESSRLHINLLASASSLRV